MRYGIIRASPRLPNLDDQRVSLEAAGCQTVFEERAQASSGQSRLLPLLERLKAGDEVTVHSLDAFDASIGDLVRMLHGFCEAGVTLRILGDEAADIIAPLYPTPRALVVLAAHEARHPTRGQTRRRARAVEPLLTPHQLRFARDMQRRGYGMREIGLLFRMSPNEMAVLLSTSPGARADQNRAVNPTENVRPRS